MKKQNAKAGRASPAGNGEDGALVGEFLLRGQNGRMAPLVLRWRSEHSLYYGGRLEVVDGPVGLKSRFESRLADRSWLRNDPDRLAGGRPFTESFFATVAYLMAFSDAERVVLECIESPVPRAGSDTASEHVTFREIEEFDRSDAGRDEGDGESGLARGQLRAG